MFDFEIEHDRKVQQGFYPSRVWSRENKRQARSCDVFVTSAEAVIPGGVLMADETKKCAHPACVCPAAKDSNYCSTSCEDAKDTMEISCNCGHPGCELP